MNGFENLNRAMAILNNILNGFNTKDGRKVDLKLLNEILPDVKKEFEELINIIENENI